MCFASVFFRRAGSDRLACSFTFAFDHFSDDESTAYAFPPDKDRATKGGPGREDGKIGQGFHPGAAAFLLSAALCRGLNSYLHLCGGFLIIYF